MFTEPTADFYRLLMMYTPSDESQDKNKQVKTNSYDVSCMYDNIQIYY